MDVKNNSEVEGVEYRDIASQEVCTKKFRSNVTVSFWTFNVKILIKLETKLFEAANDIDLRPKVNSK